MRLAAMPTHESLGPDDRDGLEDGRKPAIQHDQEQAIAIGELDSAPSPSSAARLLDVAVPRSPPLVWDAFSVRSPSKDHAAEAAQSEREVNSADDCRGQNLRPYD